MMTRTREYSNIRIHFFPTNPSPTDDTVVSRRRRQGHSRCCWRYGVSDARYLYVTRHARVSKL